MNCADVKLGKNVIMQMFKYVDMFSVYPLNIIDIDKMMLSGCWSDDIAQISCSAMYDENISSFHQQSCHKRLYLVYRFTISGL